MPFRVILTAFGKLKGDWKKCRDECKELALIEPVCEGILQLFCQTIILYIVLGPGEDRNSIERPIDFSHVLFHDKWDYIFYPILLTTSILTVGTSFAKESI